MCGAWLKEIEAQWGPAPGRQQSDGESIFVLGERFGNVFVGIQPAFGYEGDPMRLLFEKGFAPTHAFSAFYRWLREDFGAHAVLHFGTHGALEFMPGKQNGLSGACWPDRLIGDLPNFYLYASNNPSEGTIAKRRAAATLISYLTPPVAQAGLYRGLVDLKGSLERYRGLEPETPGERGELVALIQAQAAELEAGSRRARLGQAERRRHSMAAAGRAGAGAGIHADPAWPARGGPRAPRRRARGTAAGLAEASHGQRPSAAVEALVAGQTPDGCRWRPPAGPQRHGKRLASWPANELLAQDHELPGMLRALDGRLCARHRVATCCARRPSCPPGRNLHGFDPFRIPSALRRAGRRAPGAAPAGATWTTATLPESIALVLWGTDNLKTEGGRSPRPWR
jgi:magnesium chelatase subunit H